MTTDDECYALGVFHYTPFGALEAGHKAVRQVGLL
jgi:hypothetical protein